MFNFHSIHTRTHTRARFLLCFRYRVLLRKLYRHHTPAFMSSATVHAVHLSAVERPTAAGDLLLEDVADGRSDYLRGWIRGEHNSSGQHPAAEEDFFLGDPPTTCATPVTVVHSQPCSFARSNVRSIPSRVATIDLPMPSYRESPEVLPLSAGQRRQLPAVPLESDVAGRRTPAVENISRRLLMPKTKHVTIDGTKKKSRSRSKSSHGRRSWHPLNI